VLGQLIGPTAFGYSVELWNSDLIASCAAAACMVAAGYFFATKPPKIGLRFAILCRPQPNRPNTLNFTGLLPQRRSALSVA
jgi:hypothetical protein